MIFEATLEMRDSIALITLAGELDAEAFLPYADTISGSRWPGENGGPKRG